MEQDFTTLAIWYAIGFLGILIHWVKKVYDQGGLVLSDFTAYVAHNSLAVLLSILAYSSIVVIWVSEGFEFLGMIKGQLNGSLILYAFASDSLFKSFVKVKVTDKQEQMEKEEPK